MTSKDKNNKSELKPLAIILAGYNKVDSATKKRKIKEIMEAYDGEEVYMGENKFLQTLAGKPIIQYVLDAVYNAQKNGARLYDEIYLYNDKESFKEMIDIGHYPHLYLKQMTDSVGGHIKDFYNKYLDYGQRVDVFFGDTPRITPQDVEWIHEEYNSILGKKKNHKGIPITLIYGVVESDDLTDNWLEHRIKVVKRGANKGKLKSFVGFEGFQARVGNTAAIIKDTCLDKIFEHKVLNFVYNMRKALTPSVFSKIIYHIWRIKKFDVVRQVKHRCLDENKGIDTVIEVLSKLYKIDVSNFTFMNYHIKKNASRWENDIDGPRDLEVFQRKFIEFQQSKDN